jgi:hypothetical protein
MERIIEGVEGVERGVAGCNTRGEAFQDARASPFPDLSLPTCRGLGRKMMPNRSKS